MEGLPYLIDNPRSIPIVATSNQMYGMIHLNVVPCEPDGNEEINEDLLTDDPKDMINQTLDFKIKVSHITDLPEDFCSNVYCEYKFYMDEQIYRTPVCYGKNQNPQLEYVKQHHVECVTQYLIDYLLEDKLTIKIYANQDLKKKKVGSSVKGTPMSQDNSVINSSSSTASTANRSNYSIPATAVKGKDVMMMDPLRGMKGNSKNK